MPRKKKLPASKKAIVPKRKKPSKKTPVSSSKKLSDSNKELRESQYKLQLALQSARMGIWEWTFRTNTVTWSDEAHAIFGLIPGTVEVTFDLYQQFIHPEDRERVLNT